MVATTAERVKFLRAELNSQNFNGFIVPRTDEHQSEYVAPNAERLAWLTNFTGSAGNAIVLDDKAAIFVDGRYTLQAANQVDQSVVEAKKLAEITPSEWLKQASHKNQRIGFDPWLHSENEFNQYQAACENSGANLVAMESNPIDQLWQDQPADPAGPIVPHDIKYAGKSHEDKISEIASQLADDKIDAVVISALDSIAWLLNIRCNDIAHSPLALVFAVLNSDGTVTLFADPKKITDELTKHLGPKVSISSKSEFVDYLQNQQGKQVQVDPNSTPYKIVQVLRDAGAKCVYGTDPCILPKACKNPVEVKGTIAAHTRDGAALTNFLAWIESATENNSLMEIAAADKLLEFRRKQPLFQDMSFPTISGSGPNGAIVHYMVDESTNSEIKGPMLYLVDSGGQYLDGTTDVTRVVAIGNPTQEQRTRYTQVLKGHIALTLIRFPEGTCGMQLDVLARQFLWNEGLDYAHGTGHGVGSYLCVHEGPQRIAQKASSQPLLPGMIVSIEPGYYKTGEYGIRIENLAVVEEKSMPSSAEQKMLGFKPLTFAPINRNLINKDLLTADELSWLNNYHTEVREKLTPLVDEETKPWLEIATQPLG